jgi:lipopolysaccharide biosynthesis glycosyltransferase
MKVFVGYDTREDVAWQVCKHSIVSRNKDVEVKPLKLKELIDQGWYKREEDKLGSTEFTFSRFLIPELCNFNGWAVFCDCDIIFLNDIKELFDQADDKYAVMCAKHDYTPKEGVKMDGQTQTVYPRKNWSSVMLFNCSHPSNQALTSDLVNDPNTTGKYLHRFSWLTDEEIGELSHEWNWLAGWYTEPADGKPKAIHYTEGGPWFENYRHCEYHDLWKKELFHMMSTDYER